MSEHTTPDAILAAEEALLLRAAELDTRRQEQIKRQADIITRMLGNEEHSLILTRQASELADKTWQLSVLDNLYRELVKALREARGGAADAFHVIGIQNLLTEMSDVLGIKELLEEINPPERVTPRVAMRYKLGMKENSSE